MSEDRKVTNPLTDEALAVHTVRLWSIYAAAGAVVLKETFDFTDGEIMAWMRATEAQARRAMEEGALDSVWAEIDAIALGGPQGEEEA